MVSESLDESEFGLVEGGFELHDPALFGVLLPVENDLWFFDLFCIENLDHGVSFDLSTITAPVDVNTLNLKPHDVHKLWFDSEQALNEGSYLNFFAVLGTVISGGFVEVLELEVFQKILGALSEFLHVLGGDLIYGGAKVRRGRGKVEQAHSYTHE